MRKKYVSPFVECTLLKKQDILVLSNQNADVNRGDDIDWSFGGI